MRPALELKLGQRLSMTPQLQQSIKLLQLSALELRTEIQQALDSNPLLEEDYADDEFGAEMSGVDAAFDTEEGKATADSAESDSGLLADKLPEESVLDRDFEAEFDPPVAPSAQPDSNDSHYELDNRSGVDGGLHSHLLWQVNMTPFSDVDRHIAETLIDYIGDDGYLTCSVEEITEVCRTEEAIEPDEVNAVLHRIQHFDPEGVGARDLSECLAIQLRSLSRQRSKSTAADDATLHKALRIVEEHLGELGDQNFKHIKRALDIDDDQLNDAVRLIQSLNPRPGNAVNANQTSYVVPDVVVRKWKNRWRVDLNSQALPRLRVNEAYTALVKGGNGNDGRYVRDHLNDARWFVKSIHNRNETLLRVAREIVERQSSYLEIGEKGMRPMVLADIADSLELHESTVSRATTQKYMLTPRGIVELKYFFSQGVGGGSDSHSSTAIRSMIKDIVNAESNSKPVSDNKIALMLKAQGVDVARRTVAKYREAMQIPPSSQRRSLPTAK